VRNECLLSGSRDLGSSENVENVKVSENLTDAYLLLLQYNFCMRNILQLEHKKACLIIPIWLNQGHMA